MNQLNGTNQADLEAFKIGQQLGNIGKNAMKYFGGDTVMCIPTNDKKGKVKIIPINIVNQNNENLNEIKLYNGAKYKISKELTTNKKYNTTQSVILIQRIN